jgi:signal transduction histidine kinase
MEQEERALLARRIARNSRSQQLAVIVIVVGNLLAGVLLAGAVSVSYRENRRRLLAEATALGDRNRLDLILTSLGEGVVAADANGTFTLFNPAAEALIGVGATSTPSGSWSTRYGVFQTDQVTPYAADQLPLVRALRGESSHDVEIFVRNEKRPDGVLLSVTGRPIRSQSGDVLGGVVVINDITERKRFETEIRRKNDELAHAYADLDRTRLQQLQTKDQLLSHVSHELRTPLTAAYQFAEILRDGVAGDLTPEQREYADIAFRNLKQLRSMIGDLLEATRLESAKLTIQPTRMKLAEVASDVCRALRSPAAEKGISIDNRIGAIPDVLADPDRVRQVFTNLLHNAIKFTQEGRITIDAQVTVDDKPSIDVAIADTGCGMTAEDASRVFNRLYQAGNQRNDSRQGLGLGLYICKELVTRQGGSLWVDSELGKGSTFHCTFPVFEDQAAARSET